MEPLSGKHLEPPLRGRSEECRTFRELVSTIRSGASQVLVVRGEAGVGKTALLTYLSELAEGFRCVQVSGVESDMELAFAGLHQFCAPLLDHLDDLPGPQREALDVAFGRGAGPPPDRFLVGLAVLSLMAAAASERPLLCVVDDAQWLDQVSLQTLGFVARRLVAEPVAVVFAVRDHTDVLAGLPELSIGGLSTGDASELLESVMVGGIDPRVRDRIVAETRGVPLAILEVPRSVSPTELAGGFWISGKRSSAAAIEDDFVRRIRSLPEPTQRLLLVAAAEPLGDARCSFARRHCWTSRSTRWHPPKRPGSSSSVRACASTTRWSDPPRIARQTCWTAGQYTVRWLSHRSASDPDRRAWHAANAASGPDDAVADELEASADGRRAGVGSPPRRPFSNEPPLSPRIRPDAAPGRSPPRQPSGTPPHRLRPTSSWPSPKTHR